VDADGVTLADVLAVLVAELVGDGLADAELGPEGLTVTDALLLPLGELLPLPDALSLLLGLLVELPDGELLCVASAPADAVTLALADTEGVAAMPLAETLGLADTEGGAAMPLAETLGLPLTEGEPLKEAVSDGVAESDALTDADALAEGETVEEGVGSDGAAGTLAADTFASTCACPDLTPATYHQRMLADAPEATSPTRSTMP